MGAVAVEYNKDILKGVISWKCGGFETTFREIKFTENMIELYKSQKCYQEVEFVLGMISFSI